MLIPIVGLTTVAMTVDALLVVGIYDEIDCHHVTWMAMSITGVVLTGMSWCRVPCWAMISNGCCA
jgi:hypothetical protein